MFFCFDSCPTEYRCVLVTHRSSERLTSNFPVPFFLFRGVTQMGVTAPLEAFKTATKGWGIRATRTIEEGAYICSYAGEVGADFQPQGRGAREGLASRCFLSSRSCLISVFIVVVVVVVLFACTLSGCSCARSLCREENHFMSPSCG